MIIGINYTNSRGGKGKLCNSKKDALEAKRVLLGVVAYATLDEIPMFAHRLLSQRYSSSKKPISFCWSTTKTVKICLRMHEL